MADGCSLSCTEKLGGGAGWPMGVALAAQRSWGGGGRVADATQTPVPMTSKMYTLPHRFPTNDSSLT